MSKRSDAADPQLKAIHVAIRAAMERARWRSAPLWLALAVALPLAIPLALLPATGGEAPWRLAAIEGAPPDLGGIDVPTADARRQATAAEIARTLEAGCTDGAPPCTAAEIAARDALRDRLAELAGAEDGTAAAVARHKQSTALLLFAGALGAAAALALAVAWGHVRLAGRYAQGIRDWYAGTPVKIEKTGSGATAGAALGAAFGLVAAGLTVWGLAGSDWPPGGEARGLSAWGLGGALVSAALAAAAVLTHALARQYPAPSDAAAIERTVKAAADAVRAAAIEVGAGVTADRLDLWKRLLSAEAAGVLPDCTDSTLPISPGLTPAALRDAIEKIAITAATVSVAWLTAIALGFDALEARAGAGADLAAAMSGTTDAWLVLIGLGYSAILALIYVGPTARLVPFSAAETAIAEDRKAAPAATPADLGSTWWTQVEGLGLLTVQTPNEAPADPRKEAEEKAWAALVKGAEPHLRAALGCDAAKLFVIRSASNRAGGFHEVMKSGGLKWVGQVLTLLAPALASGLLSVIV